MSITENQKRCNHARSIDAMRALLPAMRSLSPPERACMLALIASASSAPVRITLLGVQGDDQECRFVLDGVLARTENENTWDLGGGLGEFECHMTPGEDHHA